MSHDTSYIKLFSTCLIVIYHIIILLSNLYNVGYSIGIAPPFNLSRNTNPKRQNAPDDKRHGGHNEDWFIGINLSLKFDEADKLFLSQKIGRVKRTPMRDQKHIAFCEVHQQRR